MIDLELLKDMGEVAVLFSDVSEAEAFLEAMKIHYPAKVTAWSKVVYPEKDCQEYGGVCYNPNFTNRLGVGMMYSSYKRYRERGFTIVRFSDLIPENARVFDSIGDDILAAIL